MENFYTVVIYFFKSAFPKNRVIMIAFFTEKWSSIVKEIEYVINKFASQNFQTKLCNLI